MIGIVTLQSKPDTRGKGLHGISELLLGEEGKPQGEPALWIIRLLLHILLKQSLRPGVIHLPDGFPSLIKGILKRSLPDLLLSFGEKGVPHLFAALADPNEVARLSAFGVLDRLGKERIAPAYLIRRDDDGTVLGYDEVGIDRVRKRVAFQAVRGALHDGSVSIRRKAILALGRMKEGKAIPDLRPFLTDGDASLRFAAVTAVAGIGGDVTIRAQNNAILDPRSIHLSGHP